MIVKVRELELDSFIDKMSNRRCFSTLLNFSKSCCIYLYTLLALSSLEF